MDQCVASERDIWNDKKTYFLIYTGLFLIISALVFSWYFFTGRTLIWNVDGWAQHYRALVYYGEYLRSIIKTLLTEHQLVIPAWDFSIGEGADILQTFHYYVMGDPFSVFSVLVPTRFMHIYYDAMILLRLYLSGIVFSCLCFKTGIKSIPAVLAGAFTYVFCFWSLYSAARHPFFLNPMLYFPMLILGIEKILKKERPYLFIITVFLSAVSNFYFFYILVFMTVVYAAVRLLISYGRTPKLLIGILLKLFGYAVLGVLLSAVVLLPILMTFINDSRMASGIPFHIFYPISYYSSLPALFISQGASYWNCLGYSAPTLLAAFLLFRQRKENVLLKILFFICIIILVVPFLGQVLNGFSYISNRWIWAFSLLCAYILSAMWPIMMKLQRKEIMFLTWCTAAYMLVCMMLEYSRTINVFISIALVFLLLVILGPMKEKRGNLYFMRKQLFTLFIVCVSVLINSFYLSASGGGKYAAGCMERKQINRGMEENETVAVKHAALSEGQTEFYRFSGHWLTANAGVTAGLSSSVYYWSLSNPYVSEFRSKMELSENSVYNYRGLDDRTALLSLASMRYYVVPSGDPVPVPYGFVYVDTINVKEKTKVEIMNALKEELQVDELTEDQIKIVQGAAESNYSVYRNENVLPLAYTYDQVIEEKTWDKFSTLQKQEAMLQAAVIEDYEGKKDDDFVPVFTDKEVEFTASCQDSGVTMQNQSFVVTAENSTLLLECTGEPESETYFSVKGLSYEAFPDYDMYLGDESADPLNLYNRGNWEALSYADRESMRKGKLFWSEPADASLVFKTSAGVSKALSYSTERHPSYGDRHDFMVNLNYSEEPISSVTITFSKKGIYRFDSMGIFCQPMNNFSRQIAQLKEAVPDKIEVGTNKVEFPISTEKSKILCLSIPYSDGWQAFVDGKKTMLYRANGEYMALPLEKGTHSIRLQYKTPFLHEGEMITVIAVVLFLILIIVTEAFIFRKKRRCIQ